MDQSSLVVETDSARRHRIVDAALRVASRGGGWDAVRMFDVAREAGISLAQLHEQFSDRNEIAEGFFDRADAALLATAARPGWSALPVRARVFGAVMAWLDALEPQRPLVRGMLGYKLQPEHIHLQVRGIMRISRTVQCMREVALLPATGWRRELEEAGLTSMYLATFACWLTDGTPHAQRTRNLLDRLLAGAEFGALRLDRTR